MILMNLLTVSTISWRTLPCTLTICLHLRERKDRCWKFDGVTRQQRRLAVSRNLPSRNIRSWEFSIWCSKGPGKKHCRVDFQPCFQGQSSILSEIYLRDIFYLSWPDLILWKASTQWCAANMVLWSHSWNLKKIHFWMIFKKHCMEKQTWISKWLFQVPFCTPLLTWSYTLMAVLDTSDIPQQVKAPSPWALFVR